MMKKPVQPRLRFITAASLFDGHDAAINIMRRVMQSEGAEVIHLGHDRAVDEIVKAALEEDVDGIAISSYQGGHMEFFSYMVQQLADKGRGDIQVFGGGGGTITDVEIRTLEDAGVQKIYSVEDGRRLGLVGMIKHMLETTEALRRPRLELFNALKPSREQLGIALSLTESGAAPSLALSNEQPPVLGITGVGGAGKSSLTDEILWRIIRQAPHKNVAVLSVDPSKRKTGGALLGDRIRMNAASRPQIFMRSVATRANHAAVSANVRESLEQLKAADFDLIILETAGIGQSGSEVVDLSDISLYVMTPEFGAPTQLEKIDMLDYADLVVVNKSDKRGADDALTYVKKQVQRNRGDFASPVGEMPVFGCISSQFGDGGVDQLFARIITELETQRPGKWFEAENSEKAANPPYVLPPNRVRYLSEISEVIRGYHRETETLAAAADQWQSLSGSLPFLANTNVEWSTQLEAHIEAVKNELPQSLRTALEQWDTFIGQYKNKTQSYVVRDRTINVENYVTSLSGSQIPKVATPRLSSWADRVRFLRKENVPGTFPFTAGVFPFKRSGEDPTRMFAGEGGPERTNHRFHYLSRGQSAARLSTAFDSVTLYGRDPAKRPDIYGKVGNSGVSVATLDDAKRLYSGFDLTSKNTSVSMTINGPAPMVLAFFLNTAIDQAVEQSLKASGEWAQVEKRLNLEMPHRASYRGDLPDGHDGSGIGLLGACGADVISEDAYDSIKARVLSQVRGTVQADILKEDQAQNTCIFSTDFALKMMGDIQAYFIDHRVRNFYSVSISGYHIAEAGANPITQLAFTLANGFTFVEYYRARGMNPADFAKNLSFFFSNGVDAEYAVIGRVARRIWALALDTVYGADERSQKLKYHIQTSGRSLHAQEIDFNDIRTTLQALYAIADNCNSLHTNAYDEAITTPTEASVRRALAIQLIINRELGMVQNENPFQGSYFIEELTDLVEEAVLKEFDRITERGGVLGAMEMMYQRSKIQEESLEYEHRKHSGDLPIIGVNTFLNPNHSGQVVEVELIRATESEKNTQIADVESFQHRNKDKAANALVHLKACAIEGGNVFDALMTAARYCSLGQMTEALFSVGGQYRRNM
jgi:isobutyryl-CoA mutase